MEFITGVLSPTIPKPCSFLQNLKNRFQTSLGRTVALDERENRYQGPVEKRNTNALGNLYSEKDLFFPGKERRQWAENMEEAGNVVEGSLVTVSIAWFNLGS